LCFQECLEVLGIPNIIAFLSKSEFDAESKSLSASLLITVGNAGPVYTSFARKHGILEALCNWSKCTDDERHHVKIQVAAASLCFAVRRCASLPHPALFLELSAHFFPTAGES
jgi:hypothetical protein